MKLLKGTGVALVTPFNEDLSVDFDGLSRLVDHCITGGVDYLVVMGTTAESATLTAQEKEAIIAHIRAVNAGRLPVVLGVGGNNTAQVVQELQEGDFDGISAILSVSPAYNKPTQEGIYQHYAAIARASALPVILYNVPGRTGSNMLPETSARLARSFDTIVAIKEAVNDMTQVLQLIHQTPDDFMVISGDDTLCLPLVSAGGAGVISVIGQGIPSIFSRVMRDGLEGAFTKAYTAHLQLLKIIDLIFKEGNPAGIKSLLAHQQICKPYVRLPLVHASDVLFKEIGEAYEALVSVKKA